MWESTIRLLKIDCKFGLAPEQWRPCQGSSVMSNSAPMRAHRRFCWLSLAWQNSPSLLSASAGMAWEQAFRWVSATASLWLTESLWSLLMLPKVDHKLFAPEACSYPWRYVHGPPFFHKYQLVTGQFSTVHFPNLLFCGDNDDLMPIGFLLLFYHRSK